MSKAWLVGLAWSASLYAGTIRGVVVEAGSGHPLTRALVTAQPVTGTQATVQSVWTNPDGQFEFGSLPGGGYLLMASRRGFAPAQYGQKRWKSAGVPVVIESAETVNIGIRLQRYGSISGTVLDENGVGMPDRDVVAYRNSRPPVVVARASTDDRGVYYLWGLEPGSYLVRTAGKADDDGSYRPTFSRETAYREQAYPVEVELDREIENVDVRPLPGPLFPVAGTIAPPRSATVMLISEMGREMVTSDGRGRFRFPPVAPGSYELYAEWQAGRTAGGPRAAYQAISVDGARRAYQLTMGPLPELQVEVADASGQLLDPNSVPVLMRRKDLASIGQPATFHSPQVVVPGQWEVSLAPDPNYCAMAFSGQNANASTAIRADGWQLIVVTGSVPTAVRFVVSPHPAMVHGTVRDGGKPAVGAPVFLEPYDPQAQRAVGEVRASRSDIQGRYEFYGLAPGSYRLLGTFEFQAPDEAAMNAARVVRVAEGQDQGADLDLYARR